MAGQGLPEGIYTSEFYKTHNNSFMHAIYPKATPRPEVTLPALFTAQASRDLLIKVDNVLAIRVVQVVIVPGLAYILGPLIGQGRPNRASGPRTPIGAGDRGVTKQHLVFFLLDVVGNGTWQNHGEISNGPRSLAGGCGTD